MNSILKKFRGEGKHVRTVNVFVDEENVTFEIPIVKSDEKNIKKSWLIIKNHWKLVFAEGFIRWFRKFPELRKLFRRFPTELRVDVLQESAAFIAHAEKFEEIIELTIATIHNDPTRLINTLVGLGRSHYYLGAKQKYATSLADSIQEAITDVTDCDENTSNSWTTVLHFIIGLLKVGISTEEKIMKKKKYSFAS